MTHSIVGGFWGLAHICQKRETPSPEWFATAERLRKSENWREPYRAYDPNAEPEFTWNGVQR